MIKNNYSKAYTYTIIVNIKFANEVKEKLCRYTFDINLISIDKIIDKLHSTLIDENGAPTLEFTNWIIKNHPNFKVSDILQSKVFFEFVDSLPAIDI